MLSRLIDITLLGCWIVIATYCGMFFFQQKIFWVGKQFNIFIGICVLISVIILPYQITVAFGIMLFVFEYKVLNRLKMRNKE